MNEENSRESLSLFNGSFFLFWARHIIIVWHRPCGSIKKNVFFFFSLLNISTSFFLSFRGHSQIVLSVLSYFICLLHLRWKCKRDELWVNDGIKKRFHSSAHSRITELPSELLSIRFFFHLLSSFINWKLMVYDFNSRKPCLLETQNRDIQRKRNKYTNSVHISISSLGLCFRLFDQMDGTFLP